MKINIQVSCNLTSAQTVQHSSCRPPGESIFKSSSLCSVLIFLELLRLQVSRDSSSAGDLSLLQSEWRVEQRSTTHVIARPFHIYTDGHLRHVFLSQQHVCNSRQTFTRRMMTMADGDTDTANVSTRHEALSCSSISLRQFWLAHVRFKKPKPCSVTF